MSVRRIIIGKKYKDTFECAYKLLQKGKIKDADAKASVDEQGRPMIETPTCNYVYGDMKYAENAQVIAINDEGASWFSAVRGGASQDDGSSEWEGLLNKISTKFHMQYSIIEYKRCGNDNPDDAKGFEDGIRNVVKRLFNVSGISLTKGRGDAGTQDIYGAFVKLDLCGTGQAFYTVMAKIYFRRTGVNKVYPLSSREASIVDAMLEKAPANTDTLDKDVRDVPVDTLTAIDELVKGEKYSLKFGECLCFSKRQVVNPETKAMEDNYDLKTFKKLIESASHNGTTLRCTSIKVLSISHVKWNNAYYDVYFGTKPLLRAVIGFGGSLSLRCINCNEDKDLIYSNTIEYSFVNEEGVTVNRSITLETDRSDLGIDDETVNEIVKYSELANHLKPVYCQWVARTNNSCSAYVCGSQSISVGDRIKCANCPYPEEVYTDFQQDKPARYFTSTLRFAVDRMAMVSSDSVSQCSCCGRTFTNTALTNGNCPLCKDLADLSGEKKVAAKKAYGRYRNVLSHTLRIKHLFHEKYCFEDDTIVLFALGTERYVLSKFDLSTNGYIDSPKKII